MAGHNPLLAVAFIAAAAIPKYRIVTFGADDSSAVLADAASDSLIGVSAETDSDVGETCDVFVAGPVNVEYGGPVTRGAKLTADAQGRAAMAAAGNHVIGVAMASGVIGDIGTVLIVPSVF